MKKLLLLLLLIAGNSIAEAQSLRHGVEAGVGLSKPVNSSGDVQPAFNIAYRMEYNFGKNNTGWYLRSGAGLHYKPCKDSSVFDGEDDGYIHQNYSSTFRPWYLQVPLQAGYRFRLSEAMKLQLETGPYLAVGLWGNARTTDAKSGLTEKYHCFGDAGAYRRVSCGWGFGAAMQLRNHLQLGLNYGIDFTEQHNSLYNQTLGISTAWIF